MPRSAWSRRHGLRSSSRPRAFSRRSPRPRRRSVTPTRTQHPSLRSGRSSSSSSWPSGSPTRRTSTRFSTSASGSAPTRAWTRPARRGTDPRAVSGQDSRRHPGLVRGSAPRLLRAPQRPRRRQGAVRRGGDHRHRPAGQHPHAGTGNRSLRRTGTGIEYGWSTPNGLTLAGATTGYEEGQVTPAGRSMRAWLNALGANAGNG